MILYTFCKGLQYKLLNIHSDIILSFQNVVIPLTHHKNSGYTELKVFGGWCSIILLFTAFLVGVLVGVLKG
ncbi:MAG: hypothetical protein E7493_08910 [Ruminococcus albus]|nr:hypothetical protein [Ruminococcus albus]